MVCLGKAEPSSRQGILQEPRELVGSDRLSVMSAGSFSHIPKKRKIQPSAWGAADDATDDAGG